MIKQLIILGLVTLIPTLELRASIPYGIFGSESFGISGDMSPYMVAFVCIIMNILLGWVMFWAMEPIVKFLERFSWFEKRIEPILERAKNKLHPYVEKYGFFGVAVFIAIPLPLSGAYTGAIGAYVIGLDKKRFAIANVIGVILAGVAVTTICMLGNEGVKQIFLKR